MQAFDTESGWTTVGLHTVKLNRLESFKGNHNGWYLSSVDGIPVLVE